MERKLSGGAESKGHLGPRTPGRTRSRGVGDGGARVRWGCTTLKEESGIVHASEGCAPPWRGGAEQGLLLQVQARRRTSQARAGLVAKREAR